jgi:hypothetical protein
MAKHVRISCQPDAKTYLYLAKRAKRLGVSVEDYAANWLVSFFSPKGVSATRSKVSTTPNGLPKTGRTRRSA